MLLVLLLLITAFESELIEDLHTTTRGPEVHAITTIQRQTRPGPKTPWDNLTSPVVRCLAKHDFFVETASQTRFRCGTRDSFEEVWSQQFPDTCPLLVPVIRELKCGKVRPRKTGTPALPPCAGPVGRNRG